MTKRERVCPAGIIFREGECPQCGVKNWDDCPRDVMVEFSPRGLPGKVKIGYRDYTVEDWHPAIAGAVSLYGKTSHPPAIIYVDQSYGDVHSASTFLHEIFHGIWSMYDLPEGEGEQSEERFVGRISIAFASLGRDNPGLLTRIDEMLQGTQPGDMR